MIQLIGVKNNCSIDVRQEFSIISAKLEAKLNKISKEIGSTVIVSTCNRTEIYIESQFEREQLLEKVFECLDWNKELAEFIFYAGEEAAVKHLMEVVCGFHSKIVGEDQILSQVKLSYEIALKNKCVRGALQRLFQIAVTCGKKFKDSCDIYKIPVSSASIITREAQKRGITDYMIIGFGETGSLVLKYLISGHMKNVYVVVRDINKIIDKESYPKEVKFISFDEKNNYISKADCIISCTSAPHIVVKKDELPLKKLLIYDLAVPRDIDMEALQMENVEMYNIDDINIVDEENKTMRINKMKEYRFIINDAINQFKKWKSLSELSPEIQELKNFGEKINSKRIKTFKNKKSTKDIDSLAEMLLKSTSNVYINNAIDVLKEAKLEGREGECLRIIKKIFC